MIGYVKGKILNLKPTRAIISTGGVGFIVNSTINSLEKLKVGNEVEFWTYMAVRENSIDLYGFETETDLIMFEMLLSVSGIGPKSALAILGLAGTKAIEEAVWSGDTSSLTKISGVGRKTAEKIVLELNGKIASISDTNSTAISDNVDVYEALVSLGYKERDIQETIKKLPKDLESMNEKIKFALKNLGK